MKTRPHPARRTPPPLTCAGTAGWTPSRFQDQSSSRAVSEQRGWRCESRVCGAARRGHRLDLTASLFSSSLTAWMVSLHSAIRVSYRCSLVSSLDACTEGQLLITTSCCSTFERWSVFPFDLMDGTKERPLAPTKALILLERPAQKHWLRWENSTGTRTCRRCEHGAEIGREATESKSVLNMTREERIQPTGRGENDPSRTGLIVIATITHQSHT